MAMIRGTAINTNEGAWRTLLDQQRIVTDVEGSIRSGHVEKQCADHVDGFDATVDSMISAELQRRDTFDNDLRGKITLSSKRVLEAQSRHADAEEMLQIVLKFKTKAQQHHEHVKERQAIFDQYAIAREMWQSNEILQIHHKSFIEEVKELFDREVNRLGLEERKSYKRTQGMCAAAETLESMIDLWDSRADGSKEDLRTNTVAFQLVHDRRKAAMEENAKFLEQRKED